MAKRVLLPIATASTIWIVVAFWLTPPTRSEAQVNAHHQTVASPRWQIHRADMSVSAEGDERSRSATNTILLDTVTGETWLLWPVKEEKAGYAWLKLARKDQ